jgi:Holliday junction resolvase RusA-like endonuclease
MTLISVFVAGIPAPQGSKTFYGRGRVVESSKAAGPWRKLVSAEVRRERGPVAPPLAGPLWARLTFTFPRPQGHYGRGKTTSRIVRPGAPAQPDVKPDIDKLARCVLDGLTDAGAWKDDGQVTMLTAVKQYGPRPGCQIILTTIEGD